MKRVDTADIITGALISATGIFFATYSVTQYDIGTIYRMGPGMFPLGIGLVLTGLGVLITVPAFFRSGTLPQVDTRSLVMVLLGIAAFALLVGPLGLAPAIFASTILSSYAERKVKPLTLAVLCVSLACLAYLVFLVGLGLPLFMFKWPF
ncbi:tripartite tricarboxylate transporter TctB family protein [Poseidonocella sedimentorum]|uniref:Tripartite tricarboxylate transporter TctB family protein n=1 Tax=Poseidonocella sedimentorum TaxID=871652 RepID=A0A1I6D7P2_9RHOB|nr:tripartite tricarboxylate transporter TctB family protein [Poseidonocella sedimentorum]SFR01433.1 Tripartite tricarboxylate transporter TctB family protein [Poseidonocella sedimentorum]